MTLLELGHGYLILAARTTADAVSGTTLCVSSGRDGAGEHY